MGFCDLRDGVCQAVGRHGFEQISARVRLESRDGMRLICRDEDDDRRIGESQQQPGQFEAIESGHADVEEHAVVVLALEQPKGFGRIGGDVDDGHCGLFAQQELKVVARGCFVIDDEHAQPRGVRLRGPTRC